jgi:alpha-tubulin suppressor-like RCC1 family protein
MEAGDRHAMALTADNELYTWGFNEEGTTGHQRTVVAAQYADTYYESNPSKFQFSVVVVDSIH